MSHWKYKIYRSFWNALDLLFPPACAGCGNSGSRWCETCRQNVKILNGTLCEICGLPQEKPGICPACLADRPRFHSLRAWAVFEGPVQSALHRLKYRRDIAVGEMLANEMLPFVRGFGWKIDLVVPVPLGRQRMRERGYNQVAMIAIPLALALGYRYAPAALKRKKETRTQVGLSREQRRVNVNDAFQAGEDVKKKTVLIIDDVSTTGATLSSGAQALYTAGARHVFALTVARAMPHHDLGFV